MSTIHNTHIETIPNCFN